MKKEEKIMFPFWGPVVPIAVIICICLLLILSKEIVFYFDLEPQMGLNVVARDILGLFLTATGLFFFAWGFIHLKPAGVVGKSKKLRQTGAYALTRNPMYFGINATFWGIGLFLDSLFVLMAAFLWLLINYSMVIFWEEKMSFTKFGKEYLVYKKRVPRFFPIRFKRKK